MPKPIGFFRRWQITREMKKTYANAHTNTATRNQLIANAVAHRIAEIQRGSANAEHKIAVDAQARTGKKPRRSLVDWLIGAGASSKGDKLKKYLQEHPPQNGKK